ncbi:GUN4 domain-containing protein [Pseudanabaena sp. FACHB-2040]|uniref:GUN4 domain-containing protein n=1 Tax=Pseudanabaena sp. FACHB-2040 TaxID=2692859 RepID=UPI001686AA78|nr:GUN4 domain-containing protein [Pseudanabaena sp. FACHB-2040]MBD2257396.1 GUN4 domain-containing protein [Pseudanabaena sp. FACHB-2040]
MARNWALVIGIDSYNPLNFSPLKYAKRDAEQVKALFEALGFDEVCYFSDDSPPLPLPSGHTVPTLPTYGNLLAFLQDRFEQPFLTTGDNCWFFFAGHGERVCDRDYLMPIDANSRGTEVFAALQVNYVRERLSRCGADNVIMILDACRSQGSRDGSGIGREVQQGVITISACSPSQKSWEIEDLGHGAFTYALLEALHLPGERSCATVERLGNYLKHRVPELCRQYGKVPEQMPRISADPSEKHHFILMPQHAWDTDIATLKKDAYRLAFVERNLLLAKQVCVRAIAAARGLDQELLDLHAEIKRLQTKRPFAISRPTAPASLSGDRSLTRAFAEEPSTLTQSVASRLSLLFQRFTRPATAPEPPPRSSGIGGESILSRQQMLKWLGFSSLGLATAVGASPALKRFGSSDSSLNNPYRDDLTGLETLLRAGQWKQADQETLNLLLKIADREAQGFLDIESVLRFPCDVLQSIDRLWLNASNGKFGFSVQRKLYVEGCGGPTNGIYDENAFRCFAAKVGWRIRNASIAESEVIFNTSAPVGHLPFFVVRRMCGIDVDCDDGEWTPSGLGILMGAPLCEL